MPDMTVTWPGAVAFDALKGQNSVGGRGVVADAQAMSGGFDIRPFHDSSAESAYKGSVPYAATDETDFDWAREFEEATVEVVTPKKAGRPRKAG